tara:strand:+ start:12943 stop:13590 length:648 start_codon:yes stop_codon:yes gene_type:complete
VCTTNLKQDNELVEYLQKEGILTFRGSEHDILGRFLEAAEYFNTEVIVDVEADKIYTDPKYVELISSELQNTEIDFITGNNSLEKFEPESGFHGFMPAGITVRSLKKICDLKKTENTETGYKEFFTENKFVKKRFLLPESDILIPTDFRFSLDYSEDFELAKIIFSRLGTSFDTRELLNFIKENHDLHKIVEPVIGKWKNDYKKDITKFNLDKSN